MRSCKNLGKVDIHIIASAQVKERSESVAVKPGGYLVHASWNSDYTGVRKNTAYVLIGESLGANKPFVTEKVGGVDLLLYDIELDLTRMRG